LDLSRKRVDVCLISSEGELVEHFRAHLIATACIGLSRRVAVYDEPVRGVVESMNGAQLSRLLVELRQPPCTSANHR
jgi:hypothetical protein